MGKVEILHSMLLMYGGKKRQVTPEELEIINKAIRNGDKYVIIGNLTVFIYYKEIEENGESGS